MTEKDAIERIKQHKSWGFAAETMVALDMAIQALEENKQYGAMEQRLKNVYGECDGLLEKVVDYLIEHKEANISERITKAMLLTNEDVDNWDVYRAIGTIEEFKALKEKTSPKKPIRNDLCTCPSCGTYNEVIGKRRNTVAFDTVYCWHCGQAMEIKRD